MRGLWLVAMGILCVSCSDDSQVQDSGGPKEDTAALCQDGRDNDSDGYPDCRDEDCWAFAFCEGKKDGGPLPDGTTAGTDGAPPTSCSASCPPSQVCIDGACTPVGPDKPCGSQPYPTGLPANDGIFYVDSSFTGAGDGTQQKPFKTIAAALAAIPKDDPSTQNIDEGKKYTVAVTDGTYDDPLVVGHPPGEEGREFSADIYCRCPERVIIASGLQIKPAVTATRIEVTVDGCGINLPGFVADTASDWPASEGTYGIEASGGANTEFHVLIRDCVVAGWGSGVYFSAEPSPLLESSLCLARCRLAGNIRGVEAQSAPANQVGTPFDECKIPFIEENLSLVRNHILNNKDYGVFTRQEARGVALVGNIVEKTGQIGQHEGGLGFGVYLGDTDSAHLQDNAIRENHGFGVAMINDKADASLGITLDRNLISANVGANIALQNMKAVVSIKVTNNMVLSSKKATGEPGGDGIQVSVGEGPSFNVDISGNVLDGSDRIGVLYDGTGGVVDNNTISNSGSHGCLLQQSTATVGTNKFEGNGGEDVFKSSDPVEKCGSLPVPLL